AREGGPVRDAHMNFVTAYRYARSEQQRTGRVDELLMRLECGDEVEQSEPRRTAYLALDPVRVAQLAAEHLQAAANPDQFTAVTQMLTQIRFPAALAQRMEVALHALAAGQDDEICRWNRIAHPHEMQVDLRVRT